MKKRGTWLQTALRAYQAQVYDHMQRTRQAQDGLLAAEQRAGQAGQALAGLSESWAARRREEASSRELEAVYQHFHAFLQDKDAKAADAQRRSQVQVNAAQASLKNVHAVERTLERVAQQVADHRRKEVRDKETQDAAEAWLLGQALRAGDAVTRPMALICNSTDGDREAFSGSNVL